MLAYTGVPEVFVTARDMPFIFDKRINLLRTLIRDRMP